MPAEFFPNGHSHDAQAQAQASKRRANATSWKRGQSGNPKGSAPVSAAALRAAEQALLTAICEDVAAPLNALDMALAKAAAQQLARAEVCKSPEVKVRLTRGACALIDRVRNAVAARRERKPVSAFDQYIGGMGGTGK